MVTNNFGFDWGANVLNFYLQDYDILIFLMVALKVIEFRVSYSVF